MQTFQSVYCYSESSDLEVLQETQDVQVI